MGVFNLKKGHDIPLQGTAERHIEKAHNSSAVAVQPIDFRGVRPGLKVEPGHVVKRGSILFVDKQRQNIVFRSPASGTVREIVRGERRSIQRIIINIDADSSESFDVFSRAQVAAFNENKAKSVLLNSGLWPALRQRPFNKIANPDKTPKSIFISAVDTAPLQAETDMLIAGREKDFQLGIDLLSKLTAGKINLSVSSLTEPLFKNIEGVEIHRFSGPHPAGNIGVQVHHIDRLIAGDIIWHISPRHVAQIGSFLNKGEYPGGKIYALTGSELTNRHYVSGFEGAHIRDLISEAITPGKQRVISGNVLTGKSIKAAGFVGFYDDMITVIPEPDGRRFLGWMRLGMNANSFWRLYLSKLIPGKKFAPNTDMNGEERAFVSTGEYEKVVPMDILPVHLCKAILVEDIELMEKLGIYEVAPEDFALCSYICPSKIDFGRIIEQGILSMEKEG
ncbi:MAG: Na(+)-translocating NADH-quinone reductase subunit A [Candidatus Marinimicrobia bacterium]|nr:Na(+)-translocating NADH-quinone reductase subunit A [Candidatus Neomarinimicrobiota bacterium]